MKKSKLLRSLSKKIFIPIMFFCTLPTSAQTIKSHTSSTSNSFIGLGFGINDYGLGIGGEVKTNNKLWLYGNGGISTWGFRLNGGLTYYPETSGYKSSFSLGYSYAFGIDDHNPTLEVYKYDYSSTPEFIEKPVLMDLHPISTINFFYSYNLKVGLKSKFVFSGGYALVLTDELYQNKSNYRLSQESEDFIDIMAPGGVIIGVKFMI